MHMFQSLFKQNEQTVDGSRFSDVSFALTLNCNKLNIFGCPTVGRTKQDNRRHQLVFSDVL